MAVAAAIGLLLGVALAQAAHLMSIGAIKNFDSTLGFPGEGPMDAGTPLRGERPTRNNTRTPPGASQTCETCFRQIMHCTCQPGASSRGRSLSSSSAVREIPPRARGSHQLGFIRGGHFVTGPGWQASHDQISLFATASPPPISGVLRPIRSNSRTLPGASQTCETCLQQILRCRLPARSRQPWDISIRFFRGSWSCSSRTSALRQTFSRSTISRRGFFAGHTTAFDYIYIASGRRPSTGHARVRVSAGSRGSRQSRDRRLFISKC